MSALEIPALLRAVDSIRGWFGLLRREQKESRDQERKAIKALYVALNETLTYFRRLEHSELGPAGAVDNTPRNLQIEDSISRLWMEAAAELKGVNTELASRCFLKGLYWTDRDRWNEERVNAANIKLEGLVDDAKALLA